MYRTLVKIILELFVLERCNLYDDGVIERFEELIYSLISSSSSYEDFRDLLNTSIFLPKNSWIMVRNFISYLDNFELNG